MRCDGVLQLQCITCDIKTTCTAHVVHCASCVSSSSYGPMGAFMTGIPRAAGRPRHAQLRKTASARLQAWRRSTPLRRVRDHKKVVLSAARAPRNPPGTGRCRQPRAGRIRPRGAWPTRAPRMCVVRTRASHAESELFRNAERDVTGRRGAGLHAVATLMSANASLRVRLVRPLSLAAAYTHWILFAVPVSHTSGKGGTDLDS
jgi:hypothetical protein